MKVGGLVSIGLAACLAPLALAADTITSDHFSYLGCGANPGAHTALKVGAGFKVAPAITVATPFCRPNPQGYCRWIVYASPFGKCRAATLHSGNWTTGFDVREYAAGAAGPVIRSSVIHVKDGSSGKASHIRRTGPGLFSITTS